MQKLKLVIGDKNLSSWSMRPWLVLKYSQLPFQEIKIDLDRKNTAQKILKYSPTKKVPCLIDGSTTVWDSLAICEYIAELAPQKNLWPIDKKQRALARSYVAEIHSGFHSLRNQLPMDIRLRTNLRHLQPQTIEDIQRILQLWDQVLKRSGPFLFGDFGIVDAFYAPVVFRFLSYGIKIKNKRIQKYMSDIEKLSCVNEWVTEALKEAPPKTHTTF